MSKYCYFLTSHINGCYPCSYIKFWKFDFIENYELVKLILYHNSSSKHQKSAFLLLGVSKYCYFITSHINWCYPCAVMKFFKFDFFGDYDPAKLILNHNSSSKHQKSTFILLGASKYCHFLISHINRCYPCSYIKFFKFDIFEDYEFSKLILNHNSSSKHQESASS